ncbi:unnamed protein product [Fraxinus pennsylvanica]|uniref:Protein kinase domain-containing protein n=1 Tax=Fraxinus pennsylvanica TaxID=56036 RepID=A0AAD1YVW5_9LAMI|nr:unnamed protein product [Fraxinus pennsylvanica]
MAEIAAATNNFSLPNKIGEGGFGSVHKGLLSTGQKARPTWNEGKALEFLEKSMKVLCERPALDRRVEEDEQSLTIWAQDCISKGEIDRLVAPSLRPQISPESLTTFLEVANRCLHDEPNKRPTMAQVVVQLESALEQQSSALERTSSDSVMPCSGETPYSISVEIEEISSVDEQNMPLSLTKGSKMIQNAEPSGRGAQMYKRNKNAYKLPRFWPWNALWKRANITKKNHSSIPEYFGEGELHRFDLAEIAAATKNFSLPNRIGDGGFGGVYKGLLSTGQKVAVKRRAWDGYEFKSEVLRLSKIQHQNIIKVLGYCIHGDETIIVFDLMENKSLDAHLFGETRHELGWTIRFKIIIEIVSGRRINRPFSDLIQCAWTTWNEGKALEFLDKSMKGEFPADEALRCIQIGLLCVQELPGDRPTMQSVLEMLEGEVPSLPQPLPPPYVKTQPLPPPYFETYSGLKTSTHIDSTNEVTITQLECR